MAGASGAAGWLAGRRRPGRRAAGSAPSGLPPARARMPGARWSARGHGGGGSLEVAWTQPCSSRTAGSARGAASPPSRPAPPSPAASAVPPRPASPPSSVAAWPRARPAWRGGVASSSAHAASSSAGPRATATSSRRRRTGLGVWPPFLSLLSLSLYLSLLRRSDPAPGSRDQAAGARVSCGEERATWRMGLASRRPLFA